MSRDDSQSRRTVLKLGGGAVLTTVLAGCGGGGGGGGPGGENNTSEGGNETGGAGAENETGAGNETETGNETGAGNETETGNETGAGNETNESDGGGGAAGDALEPGEIELGGQTQAWLGVSPDPIAEEENPTLTLQEGEAYEITWENMDGVGHNIQILDDSDSVVDDYETEIMQEEGETQTLEIDEVTSEMASYVCEPHQGTMNGDIEVQ